MPALCRFVRFLTKRKPTAASVLIVEDKPSDAELIQLRFERRNIGCEVAPSGEVAAGLVRHTRYDAILVDMRLPGMSGAALLRILSKDAPSSKIVIVCGEPGDLHGLPEGELVSFIRKPVNQNSIEKLIASLKAKL